MLHALRARHPQLGRHCDDVARLATAIGLRLALGPAELEALRQGACLHDVGKLTIDGDILDKPGPLSDDEWAVIHRHTEVGADILAEVPELRPVAHLVRHSHERFDGRGYPDGLAGEQIPLGSRIIFACDAYDAMTSERPYSAPMTVGDALTELRRCAGSQFDPLVIEVLCGQIDGELSCGFGLNGHAQVLVGD